MFPHLILQVDSSQVTFNSWAIGGVYVLLVFICLYITNIFNRVKGVFNKTPIQNYITTDAKLKSVELNINGIINCDHEGVVLTWNKGACKIFGYEEALIVGKSIFIIFPEGKREQYKKEFFEFRDTGFSEKFGRPFRTVGITKSKKEVPIEVALSHWKNEQAVYFTVIIIDTTEIRKLEIEFDKLMNLYVEAEDIENFGAWKWNLITDEVYTTQGFRKIHHYSETSAITYKDIIARVYHEDKITFVTSIQNAIANQSDFTMTYKIGGLNGTQIKVLHKGRVLLGPSGVEKIFGVVKEIKE